MQSRCATKWLGALGVLVVLLGTGGLLSADEIVVGGQCDRTGPTKFIGTLLCPGVNDYIKLINKKAGSMAIRCAILRWSMPTRSTAVLRPTNASSTRGVWRRLITARPSCMR